MDLISIYWNILVMLKFQLSPQFKRITVFKNKRTLRYFFLEELCITYLFC
jgi:hypothetical protein